MDKNKASKIISLALGKKVAVKEIMLVGSGYHSDGYKIIVDKNIYFIKKIKSRDLGFEFPERKLSALVLSDNMNKRARISPLSLGVIVEGKSYDLLPNIDEDTIFYNVQEYGGDGKTYLAILSECKNKKHMDDTDRKEIAYFIKYITSVHIIKHPSKDKKQRNAVYNDFLRSIIGNPEYTLQLLHAFPKDAQLLSPKDQKEYLGLMIEQMHLWKDRGDRLCALHGDFWPANAICSKKIYFIDYSRMPWGDPSIDIGFWVSTYLFMWHNTGNNYYKELGQAFLDGYIQVTKDEEILKAIVYPLSLVAIMYAHPTWVSGVDLKVRKSFYEHIKKMLIRKEFFWI